MEENIIRINEIPLIINLKDGQDINESISLNNFILSTLPNVSQVTYIPSRDNQEVIIQDNNEEIGASVIEEEPASMEMQSEKDAPASPAVNFVYNFVYPEEFNLKPVYGLKRGRPRKQKPAEEKTPEPEKILKPPPRTRSGRVVRFPKHIEKDFKKIEIVQEDPKTEVKMSDFEKFQIVSDSKSKKPDTLESHQRKRKIRAQYRCPTCDKAYLGKNKMLEHLKKNRTHGPMPENGNDRNFDVWNYLVDITQKCPPAQRGHKFCDELTNLLHNLLLLTSALFKKIESNKNSVKIDKVFGNAIGLSPGSYHFDDTKLYKDVTVLKLITNNEFFKPSENVEKIHENSPKNCTKCEEKITEIPREQIQIPQPELYENRELNKTETLPEVGFYFNESSNELNLSNDTHTEINRTKMSEKTSEVNTELLSDNSLLNSLPNLRNSVDDLMLSAGNNLLDASSSSDELMNVDQFVNERFKKITEPEMELSGGTLNLDLPSLDLFQFHNS